MISIRKAVVGGGIAAAAIGGGALGASLLGTASAQTVPATSASSVAASSGATAPDTGKGGHIANGKTEVLLTGTNLTKATAAAKAAVPGATVVRAETDAEGAAYEVHMIKADGSKVTVKLDANFTVTATQDGMGK